jgi:hydroxyquinol 1,2-dioxygenase
VEDIHPVTRQVLDSLERTPSPRLRQVLQSLVRHLHAFARDIDLTEAEWAAAIEFLTATGQMCDDNRQEFILLSDVLGLSMLTIALNNPVERGVTESTVIGPFFLDESPATELGGDLAHGAAGMPCWVEGTVSDPAGNRLAGARLDVWESDEDGFYDVQYPDGRVSGRGHLFADDDGSYRFWCVRPAAYPIPYDGPVGRLLQATQRSPMRPPHLHFRVEVPGHRTLVTHIFPAGGEHLDEDAVFGVKESLIRDFLLEDGGTAPDGKRMEGAWCHVRFDIVLAPIVA